MESAIAILALIGPALLIIVGLIPTVWANSYPKRMTKLTQAAAIGSVLSALMATLVHTYTGTTSAQALAFSVYFDAVTAVMLALVAFLGWVVLRYTDHYLDGDANQGKFTKWLALTVAAVLLLVVSGNLLLFTLAWMATSLKLHQLLAFYPDRPAALVAARKKFVISRLGDACLVAAMVLTYQVFGSLEFATIFAAADRFAIQPEALSPLLPWLALCLVLGAALKSAQFPFHSWLPDVMETPTPVSALMHAGIINAGGFLILRMSRVMVLAPGALSVLAVFGAVTALFAALTMLTQTSIKKSLAFSTVAQMGFMLLQCGLGAFSSALLHIAAHSLYKAHAFLSSGSIVEIAKASWVPPTKPTPWQLPLAIIISVLVMLPVSMVFGLGSDSPPSAVLFAAIWQIALAYLLWNALAHQPKRDFVLRATAIAGLVSIAYFVLQALAHHWLANSLPTLNPPAEHFTWLLVGLVIGLFVTVLLLQVSFPGQKASRIWQICYVHFYNGCYVNTLANRWLQQRWPVRPVMRKLS